MAKKEFKGEIKLDVRDSKADWTPYELKRATEGAPNVLIVLYDDTGQAAWSPYGGKINMPTLQRLADNGLIYTQWHTTALCSPTRSTFLTGRNHHLNGCACITEAPTATPARWAGCRLNAQPSARFFRRTALALSGLARTTTFPKRTLLPVLAAANGRCRKGSTGSMDSSAARPISGIPTLLKTITSSTHRIRPRRDTTSQRIWPIKQFR